MEESSLQELIQPGGLSIIKSKVFLVITFKRKVVFEFGMFKLTGNGGESYGNRK